MWASCGRDYKEINLRILLFSCWFFWGLSFSGRGDTFNLQLLLENIAAKDASIWREDMLQLYGDQINQSDLDFVQKSWKDPNQRRFVTSAAQLYVHQDTHQYNFRILFRHFLNLVSGNPTLYAKLLKVPLPRALAQERGQNFWYIIKEIFSEVAKFHDMAKLDMSVELLKEFGMGHTISGLLSLDGIYNSNNADHIFIERMNRLDKALTEKKLNEMFTFLMGPAALVKFEKQGLKMELHEFRKILRENLSFRRDLVQLYLQAEKVADQHERRLNILTAEEMAKVPQSMSVYELMQKVRRGEPLRPRDFEWREQFEVHITAPLEQFYKEEVRKLTDQMIPRRGSYLWKQFPGDFVEDEGSPYGVPRNYEAVNSGRIRRYIDVYELRRHQMIGLVKHDPRLVVLPALYKMQVLRQLREERIDILSDLLGQHELNKLEEIVNTLSISVREGVVFRAKDFIDGGLCTKKMKRFTRAKRDLLIEVNSFPY